MATPRKTKAGGGRPEGYFTTSGKRVPSVTTCLSKWGDKEGLLIWANRLGLAGKDHRDERNKAASAGTIAHAMIEARIHGIEPSIPTAEQCELSQEDYEQAIERAKNALSQFDRWREMVKLEVVATELPLVSDEYEFGGTIDAVARIGGKLSVLDWKTANSVRLEMVVQTSAYANLWNEQNPLDPVEELNLLRVDKDAVSFSHHSWGKPVIVDGWEMFRHIRKAYHYSNVLRSVAA